MDTKLLSEGGWKPVLAKAKELKNKDNGLQKALAMFEKTPEEKHDECLKAVSSVLKLATDFKNDKTVKPLGDVVKYLTSVMNAATAAQKEINQAKAAAAAALKAKLEADKKAAAADKKAEAEEDEDDGSGDSYKKLATALKNLKTASDPYFFLVCDAKPYGLVVSKKDITKSTTHKKELSLMAGGSTRAPKFGTVRFDSGKYVFQPEAPVTGLAAIIQKWLKANLGLVTKVMVGAESGDDQAVGLESAVAGGPAGGETTTAATMAKEPAAEAPPEAPPIPEKPRPAGLGGLALGGSVGKGGKNAPEDIQLVQESLNRRLNAGLNVNGKLDAKTLKSIENFQKALGQLTPDGIIKPGRSTARALAENGKLPPPPPPPKPIAPPKLGKPTLARAPLVWRSTRGILETNIKELKKGVRAQYGSEHPDLLAQIEEGMQKLGTILDNLDGSLADALDKANATADKATSAAELKAARTILTKYANYVKNEPMIKHMDKNPFGVKTSLSEIITDSLQHLSKAMA